MLCIFASSMEKLFYALIKHKGRFIFLFFLLVNVCACVRARVCVDAILLSPSFEYTHTHCLHKKNRDKRYVFSRIVCVLFTFSCFPYSLSRKKNQIKSTTRYRIRRNKKKSRFQTVLHVVCLLKSE